MMTLETEATRRHLNCAAMLDCKDALQTLGRDVPVGSCKRCGVGPCMDRTKLAGPKVGMIKQTINEIYGSMYRADLMVTPPDFVSTYNRIVAEAFQRIGRGLRPRPDRIHIKHQSNGREYVVYSKKIGKRVRYVTKCFPYGKQSISKRKELAIAKGESWLQD